MILTDLPAEILGAIFPYCDKPTLLQVCRSFAATVYTTPALWTSVLVGQHQIIPEAFFYLRYRLERAGTLPLDVSFNLKGRTIDTHALIEICSVLSVHKAQIRKFEIVSEFKNYIGPILKDVLLSPSEVLPILEEIQLLFSKSARCFTDTHPAHLLGRAAELYPNLHTLHLSPFSDVIPLCINDTQFTKLTTLILDGSDCSPARMHSICYLLHHTPSLETLWFKSCDRYSYHSIHENLLPSSPSFPHGITVPVKLPRLLRLAVTTPGSSTDFLHYVEPPVLRELYLDGTRLEDFTWDDDDAQRLQDGLLAFSTRTRALKRIVFDSTYLSKSCWKWLLTGDKGRIPFPELEDISLCGLKYSDQDMTQGLDDEVLVAYAKEPRVILRNLTISRSDLPVAHAAILKLAHTIVNGQNKGSLQLNVGGSCTWFTEELSQKVESVGAVVSRLGEESVLPGWWKLGPNVDPLEGFIDI